MDNFQNIEFPPGGKYASDRDHTPFEFYVQAIPLSKTIDLKLGYFSTYSISVLAVPFSKFLLSNGVLRIITCHYLSAEDIDRVIDPSKLRKDDFIEIDTIFKSSPEKITDILREGRDLFYNCLNYLQEKDRLTIQPVFFKNEMVLAHEKCGIFNDGINKLSIDGSCNFTPSGILLNGESFRVTKSWRDEEDAKSIEIDQKNIDLIFQGKHDDYLYVPKDKLIGVIHEKATTSDLQELVEKGEHLFEKVEDLFQSNSRLGKIKLFLYSSLEKQIESSKSDPKLPSIPNRFLNKNGKLRNHQEKAIKNWFKNNGIGIYHMATGSGKTVTALSTITRLLQKIPNNSRKLGIIITVPYKHLADQWYEESKNFGYSPIICYGGYKSWVNDVNNTIIALRSGVLEYFFFITSNSTFSREKFQSVLSEIDFPLVFIADEMHNLGGKKISSQLPLNSRFRLGLSATPDRYLDESGTLLLRDFFGDAVIRYGIQDAIADQTLCKYYYYPILISLTEDELVKYKEISVRIARIFGKSKNDLDINSSEELKTLLIKRSRIVANADNKIPALRDALEGKTDSKYNLIYCGDEIEYDNFDQDQEFSGESASITGRQVDKILRIIGNELGIRANKFTAQESQDKRRELLNQFGSGDLQALVAIRCLDEGVDVPRTESAYILASSSNPRQFIQRRGRVLRQAKGKKHAKIYDFVVIPSDEDLVNEESFNIERKLLRKELERINQFASMSENPGYTLDLLRTNKTKYNLLDH